MTDVPATFRGAEYYGDSPPENGQQPTTKINEETTDVDRTLPYYRVEPCLEDLPTRGNQEENGKSQGKMLHNWSMDEQILTENPEENLFIVHKAITDLSVQETSEEEMTVRKGHQWEKITLSNSKKEISTKEKIAKQLLEEREDEDRKNKTHQAAEIQWLGFRKASHVDTLLSKHEEEPEVWNEETNDDDCNDDEDEVRVIEFKKKQEEASQFKEEADVSEDSLLSSPSSQPVTPDEQPTLGKKGDISRNAYSRYNTISYRKIRKGNTKQRIDEFESMMHL